MCRICVNRLLKRGARKMTDEKFREEVLPYTPNVILEGEYKNWTTLIACRCRKCGYTWNARPQVLRRRAIEKRIARGGGCPKCAGVVQKTHEEFVCELQEKNANIEIISEYESANKKILCKCRKCGKTWETTPHILLGKDGGVCPNEAKNRVLTTEEFKERVKVINPNIEIQGRYVRTQIPIACKCKICGYEWASSTPSSIQRGVKCPQCLNERLRQERALTQQEFEKRVDEKNPNIEILGDYVNGTTRIACRCKKCRKEWTPLAGNLLAGYSCAKCAGNEKHSHAWFVKKMRKYPDIRIIGTYKNLKEKVEVRCVKCGKQWSGSPAGLLKSGCCCGRKNGTSSQEEYIAIAFEWLYGKNKVIRQERDLIGMELDIYIPDKRIAIEPGDWIYHKKPDVFFRDMKKKDLCKEKGISLLTVYFNVEESQIFSEDSIIKTTSPLIRREDKKRIVCEVFNYFGISDKFQDVEWEKIGELSERRARRKNPEEYQKEIRKIHPNFELLTEYINSNTKVQVRCNDCGYEWEADPNRLKIIKGCPKENKTIRRRWNEIDFAEKVKSITPEVMLLTPYENMQTNILCRCRKCGNERYYNPRYLLRGVGCKVCSGNGKKTQEQFLKEMQQVNRQIKIKGEYINAVTPVECECLQCGEKWAPTPDSLLHRHGCPKCAGNKRKTQTEFEEKMREINPNIELVGLYRKRKSKIQCRCRLCGYEWETWIDVLYKRGKCPVCRFKS